MTVIYSSKQARRQLVAWLGVCVFAALFCTFELVQGVDFSASLVDAIPLPADARLRSVLRTVQESQTRRLRLLLTGATAVRREEARNWLVDRLKAETAWLRSNQEGTRDGLLAYLQRHQFHLLATSPRRLAKRGNMESLVSQTLASWYSPIGLAAADAKLDPFQSVYGVASELAAQTAAFRPQSVPAQRGIRLDYQVIGDALDEGFEREALAAWERLQSEFSRRFPHVELIYDGALWYASASAEEARAEIRILGSVSIFSTLLLLLWVFQGVRPILGVLIVIATGLLTACAALLMLFQQVHLLTLVFGTTLVGISVDYAFHFYARRAVEPNIPALQTVTAIRPAIGAGLLTSLLSFSGMALVDLGLLREMAVFAAGGLMGAYLTVVWLLPNTALSTQISAGRWFVWANRFDGVSVKRGGRWLIGGLVAAALVGVLRLHTDDDVRLLRTHLPNLEAQSQRINSIQPDEGRPRALMISAASREAVLQLQERLLPELHRMQANGIIVAFFAVSALLPSVQRQKDNYRLYGAMLEAVASRRLYDSLQLSEQDVAKLKARYANADGHFLMDTAQDSQAPPFAKSELLACGQKTCTLLIPFVAKRSSAETISNWASQHTDLRMIDATEIVTQGLADVRTGATFLLMGSYALIWFYLVARFGWKDGLRLLLAPLIALVVSLGVTGWLGIAFNLFHLVGLIVMLGIAVDYSIFYLSRTGEHATTTVAVWLSSITTILAFGLLAVSRTPALASFGSMLLLGLTVAVMATPMCTCPGEAEDRIGFQ